MMNQALGGLVRRLFPLPLLMLFAGAPSAVLAVDGSIDEGIEYQRIVPPQPTRVPDGQIEVLEVFWYGCSHCDAFEPHLHKWLENKPDDVAFRRMPAQLNPSWQLHAAAYYVAEELDVVDKVHSALFEAIHDKNRKLTTLDAVIDFFGEHGVSREQFMAAYNSFAVRAKLRHSDQQVRRYGARSVPTVIVAGKYRTNATMAGGSFTDLLKVIDHLVDKERNATPAKP